MPPRRSTRSEIQKYAMDIEPRYVVTLLYAIVTADRSNDMLLNVCIIRRFSVGPVIATEE